MKKKLVLGLLVFVALFTITGCGSKKEDSKENTDNNKTTNSVECKYDGELTGGVTFEKDGYKYDYLVSKEGWHVEYDKSKKTEPNSKICSSINNKPIISMRVMFSGVNTSSGFDFTTIDASKFDTSNVESMEQMFHRTTAEIKVKGMDTSKVNDMSYMFQYTSYPELDLSTFNTSNVTNMEAMFSYSRVKNLDLTSFDTSKVTNMSRMFAYFYGDTIDLSSFDFNSVTKSDSMFSSIDHPVTIYVKSQEQLEKLKTLDYHLDGSKYITISVK